MYRKQSFTVNERNFEIPVLPRELRGTELSFAYSATIIGATYFVARASVQNSRRLVFGDEEERHGARTSGQVAPVLPLSSLKGTAVAAQYLITFLPRRVIASRFTLLAPRCTLACWPPVRWQPIEPMNEGKPSSKRSANQ